MRGRRGTSTGRVRSSRGSDDYGGTSAGEPAGDGHRHPLEDTRPSRGRRRPHVLAPSELGTGASVRRRGSASWGGAIMDSGEAFRVERVEETEGGLITVSGRAYRDLCIGDVLEDQTSRPVQGEQPDEFAIVGISTYGR